MSAQIFLQLLNAFCLNFFVYWIISLFNMRNKRKKALIIISIVTILQLANYGYLLVLNIHSIYALYYIAALVAVLLSYYLLVKRLGGIHIGNSRRLRKFKREAKKTNSVSLKKYDNLFFVKSDDFFKLYSIDKTNNFKSALNGLDDYYIIDFYGYIILKTKTYKVYGIEIRKIEQSSLDQINMGIENNQKLIDICQKYEKIHKKKIYLDDDYNIIKEKEIK